MDSKAAHLWVAGRLVPAGRSLLRGANLHAFARRFDRWSDHADSAHAKSAAPDERSTFTRFERPHRREWNGDPRGDPGRAKRSRGAGGVGQPARQIAPSLLDVPTGEIPEIVVYTASWPSRSFRLRKYVVFKHIYAAKGGLDLFTL